MPGSDAGNQFAERSSSIVRILAPPTVYPPCSTFSSQVLPMPKQANVSWRAFRKKVDENYGMPYNFQPDMHLHCFSWRLDVYPSMGSSHDSTRPVSPFFPLSYTAGLRSPL